MTHNILPLVGVLLLSAIFLVLLPDVPSWTTSSTTKVLEANKTIVEELLLPPDGEDPHIVYDDLRYLCICAKVHYELPVKNTTVFLFPKPLDPQFYSIQGSILLEGPQLD
jgi:hypothetical protein